MPIRTFSIQTLGCKVNQYEAEQIAAALRAEGLVPADVDAHADLRVVHTCSVTVQAASKSRQTIRRSAAGGDRRTGLSLPVLAASNESPATGLSTATAGFAFAKAQTAGTDGNQPRLIVTGCWATEDPDGARRLPGVDAVLTHHDDVAAGLRKLLHQWENSDTPAIQATRPQSPPDTPATLSSAAQINRHDSPATRPGDNSASAQIQSPTTAGVKGKIGPVLRDRVAAGTTSLPLLDGRQTGRQRALLKVQDGCDAHCTYCIIPRLRPGVWSKPIDDAVEEARRLVGSGHVELVLTGIFLGAYGQTTALRRRQGDAGKANDQGTTMNGGVAPPANPASPVSFSSFSLPPSAFTKTPLALLIGALCTRVPGLRRVRLSSLEPGDLTDDLVAVLRSHAQVVPHFHLPLQSGSDALLRRMNRQYTRDDFLRMLDRVNAAFDRPALTTDIICGFPGETDDEFDRTMEVVNAARFIHVHAFAYSPRPGTAAARWQRDFVRGPVVNDRINLLRAAADRHSLDYRRQFIGDTVELLVEREREDGPDPIGPIRHGRSERYFPVWFEHPTARTGDFVRVRVESVTPTRTHGGVC